MKSPDAIHSHIQVASKVPDIEQVQDSERNLGSYTIGTITDQDIVPMGLRAAIEADYSSIDILNNPNLDSDYQEFLEQLNQDPRKKEALDQVSKADRKLFTAALFANDLAGMFFSENKVAMETRNKSWTMLDPEDPNSYLLRKLSETKDSGYCVEYSLFTKEVMAKLGANVDYTVGYYQFWPDEKCEYHAFLTGDNGRVLIDPTTMAHYAKAKSLPMGLYRSQDPSVTLLSSPDKAVNYVGLSGLVCRYSASPIPAQFNLAA